MPEGKISKALKLNEDDMEMILLGRVDDSIDADLRHKRVQELVAKIILLGKKRGRPKQDEESHEAAA
jgi:hypothetical protein